MRARWADPEARARRITSIKNAMVEPECRARWLVAMEASKEIRLVKIREALARPDVRARTTAGIRACKAQRSASLKAYYANPDPLREAARRKKIGETAKRKCIFAPLLEWQKTHPNPKNMLGKKHQVHVRKLISEAPKREWADESKRKIRLERQHAAMTTPEFREKMRVLVSKRPNTLIAYQKSRSPEQRDRDLKKMMLGQHTRPTKPEKSVGQPLPPRFKYMGDGKLILGGRCPDFADVDARQAVCVHGHYWHEERPGFDRQDVEIADHLHYAGCGYNLLIVWDGQIDQSLIEAFVK